MTTMTETTQVFETTIRATPEAIWDALTNPEQTDRYGYKGRVEYDLRPGGVYRAFAGDDMKAHGAPDVVVDGEVIEADAPRKLVQTWHAVFGPETAAEAPTRLTFETQDAGDGESKVTLTHELEGAPLTAAYVTGSVPDAGGGWNYVLSDLKSLLETGKALDA